MLFDVKGGTIEELKDTKQPAFSTYFIYCLHVYLNRRKRSAKSLKEIRGEKIENLYT